MEINRTTIGVFRVFRIFGFGPYSPQHHRIYRDEVVAIKLSRLWCIYSISLLMLFGLLSNLGLHYEAGFPYPIR